MRGILTVLWGIAVSVLGSAAAPSQPIPARDAQRESPLPPKAEWTAAERSAFVNACAKSNPIEKYFRGACACDQQKLEQLGWTAAAVDDGVLRGDAKLAATMTKVAGDCLDTDPAGFDRFLKGLEPKACATPSALCECLVAKAKKQWSKPTVFLKEAVEPKVGELKARWHRECAAPPR
ncbi:MAG: hypothetical protein QM765_20970 [Myxococcales bacterium]